MRDMKTRRDFIRIGAAATALAYTPLFLQGNNFLPIKASGYDQAFLTACTKGQLEKVKQLLQENRARLKAKDEIGRSGFALALLAGHRPVGQYLKDEGYETDLHESALDLDWERFGLLVGEETEKTADQINADHPLGGSTMWAAAAGGAGTNIWRIYAKSGDPNHLARGEKGSSPLQKALRFSDLNTAELTAATLLSNNTNPNPIPNTDKPPLHIAAERGSIEMVEMLIRLGAEVDRRDNDGKRAIQLAETFGHRATWELLDNHKDIPRTCRTSRAAYKADGSVYELPDLSSIPLYKQLRLVGQAHGNLEAVQKAVAADPRITHAVATTSEKAVEAAAHTGRKKLVEFLLKNGAPYSLPTAVLLNDFTTVKRLLDEDPNRIEERGAHDFALLWYPVIGQCDLEMTQLLLDRGAKIEQQHFLGTTALHFACRRSPIELIELLIENGADVNRVSRKFKAEGLTPLQIARDEKVKDYLRSKGAK